MKLRTAPRSAGVSRRSDASPRRSAACPRPAALSPRPADLSPRPADVASCSADIAHRSAGRRRALATLLSVALAATPGLGCAAVGGSLLSVTRVAHAQSSARRYLEQRHDEVNRILRRDASGEAAEQRQHAQLTRVLNALLDYEALSRASLREHWEARSEEDRERFVSLLRQLVERNYQGNLERILDYEVSYGEETRRGDNTIVVTSARSRTQRRQPPVEIEYTLSRDGGEYRVVDVRTDGVSMVENYRNQFNRIIDRDGWDELISRMERRLERDAG